MRGYTKKRRITSEGHGNESLGEPSTQPPQRPSVSRSDQDIGPGLDEGSRLTEERSRPEPITTIDWRAELCRVLEESYDASNEDILDKLEGIMHEVKEARRRQIAFGGDVSVPPRYQIIYRISCEADGKEKDYEKPPWLVRSGPQSAHLRASANIPNMELYLERNQDIAFLVYVDFQCCSFDQKRRCMRHHKSHLATIDTTVSELMTGESIVIVSGRMQDAFQGLAGIALEDIPHPSFTKKSWHKNESSDSESIGTPLDIVKPGEDASMDFSYPFLWWFHRRTEIDEGLVFLDGELQLYLAVFQSYLCEHLKDEWNRVDALMSQQKISTQYLAYIFVPGQIIVKDPRDGNPAHWQGFEATDWLVKESVRDFEDLLVRVKSWIFDGTFRQVPSVLRHPLPHPHSSSFNISELSFYPVQFANDQVVANLRDHGRMFWKCRNRNYVVHRNLAGNELQHSIDSRYMVDMDTYKQMHPDGQASKSQHSINTIEAEIMELDEPGLDDSFFMCLPTRILGFNMQKKQWDKLDVHFLKDVRWDTKAFDYLVIDPDTKELIKAVVMNHLGGQANNDLIRGKGDGLFLLLHGGPGTGKTMTAESVAEIAKRPLYRVTCGDIGTKAEEVERYLEVVLHLGTKWGCVVLLDEADVFLEQRSLHNLERNALVSVFLRVLEYYDGILILTSNRVGTFDEAFKSRIQLNLRYSNLGQPERLQIWRNFLLHLNTSQKTVRAESASESQTESVISHSFDIESLERNLEELSQENLNGREIRNTISTARQLAMFRGESLQHKHLQSVLQETKKFEKYIQEVHLGFSGDDIQRSYHAR